MKQWKHIISAEEARLPLAKILKAAGFTKKEISRLKFIPDGITLDGKKCRVTQLAAEGQQLVLNLDEPEKGKTGVVQNEKNEWKEMLSTEHLEILYEDDSLLIVVKPSGMSCHPGRGHYQDNLGSLAVDYCSQKGEKISIRQIGRLDKDTSGIVVFAKNKIAAARLWKQREDGRFRKKYRAWVHGRMEASEGVICLSMLPVPGEKNKMYAVFAEDDLKEMQKNLLPMRAVTHYKVIDEKETEGGAATLVECTLETGRTHQIRVHMSAMGHPLFGDSIYGIEDGAKRLCLHAGEVCLYQPFTGAQIILSAEETWM